MLKVVETISVRLEKGCPRALVKGVVDLLVMVAQRPRVKVKEVIELDVCHVYGVLVMGCGVGTLATLAFY